MEISDKYFIQILLEKLKVAKDKLDEADNDLYDDSDQQDAWHNVRNSGLIIDDLIDAIQ